MHKLLIYISVVFAIKGGVVGDDLPCAARAGDNDQGYICVCNSTYCDTIQYPTRLPLGQYYHYKTSNSTPGFTKSSGQFFQGKLIHVQEVTFTINSTSAYQEIVGFGGAITDVTGLNVQTLPQAAQDKFMESYFGPTGIEYNMLRLPIGGSDFSTRFYTLDDVPYDDDLKHFSLTSEDYEIKIPFIKAAMNISQKTINLLGCTWYTPSWMKNGDSLKAQYVSSKYIGTWAKYHVRFLEEYRKEGISVWALSGGNEVMMLTMSFMQQLLNFTMAKAPDQRSFIKNHLKPQLVSANFSDVKILTLDDERPFSPYWMDRMSNDPEALSAIDGISLHTYFDRSVPTSILDYLHEHYPSVSIYYTETSINKKGEESVILGSWVRAEIYLASIFENLNHWSRTFFDWNLALDVNGGPSLSYNIEGPVIINKDSGEFYKQPIFYAMGHFSKFVLPGSKRIQVTSNQTTEDNSQVKEAMRELLKALKTSPIETLKTSQTPVPAGVQCIAFSNPDGSSTAMVMNTRDEPVKVRLVDPRVGSVSLEIEEHSINSLVYWP